MGLFTILVWILIGGLAGWIATKFTGDDAQNGVVMNVVIGIVGGLVGGSLWTWLTTGNLTFENSLSTGSLGGFVIAIIGAVVLLSAIKFLKK